MNYCGLLMFTVFLLTRVHAFTVLHFEASTLIKRKDLQSAVFIKVMERIDTSVI